MIKELELYYSQIEEPHRSCLLALRSIILSQDGGITETQKWGMPCFCYQKRPLCYLWTDKNNNGKPYILMVDGHLLTYPELEAGDRSKMKILRIEPEEDLPIEVIKNIFDYALQLRRK
ncbi:MAG: DUF1801 domain-containing protein [Dysgonomonas sp.]|nr:DUF1801 domain-containing protein [Dysgonomonas sp.]